MVLLNSYSVESAQAEWLEDEAKALVSILRRYRKASYTKPTGKKMRLTQ
jgi:hypothetical protein